MRENNIRNKFVLASAWRFSVEIKSERTSSLYAQYAFLTLHRSKCAIDDKGLSCMPQENLCVCDSVGVIDDMAKSRYSHYQTLHYSKSQFQMGSGTLRAVLKIRCLQVVTLCTAYESGTRHCEVCQRRNASRKLEWNFAY